MAGRYRLRERHHVVSAGYLRGFTLDQRTALLLDKESRTAKSVGVRDMFTFYRLNSIKIGDEWSDDLERQWDRVENATLPLVREVIAGRASGDALQAVKVLAALHLLRSYAYVEVHERIAGEVFAEHALRLRGNEDLRALFVDQYRRDPASGEIDRIVADYMKALHESNRMLVEQMAANYNKILDRFEHLHVQIIVPNSRHVRFATGETPVVHFDHSTLRLGLRSGLAFGDAQHFYMPLAPHVAVMFTTNDEGHQAINPVVTKWLNHLVWRASGRFLVCSPADDPNRLFVQRGFRFVGPRPTASKTPPRRTGP
jgi:hypothetical protein